MNEKIQIPKAVLAQIQPAYDFLEQAKVINQDREETNLIDGISLKGYRYNNLKIENDENFSNPASIEEYIATNNKNIEEAACHFMYSKNTQNQLVITSIFIIPSNVNFFININTGEIDSYEYNNGSKIIRGRISNNIPAEMITQEKRN